VETRSFPEEDAGRSVRVEVRSTTYGAVMSNKRAFKLGKRARITGLSPRSGPCSGNTRVTVHGSNFRTSNEHSQLVATVAGSPARVLQHSSTQVVLATGKCSLGATKGVVTLQSPSIGKVTTPYSLKYKFNSLPVVHHLDPEVGHFEGGGDVLVRGDRLCAGECKDLVSVRVGDAVVTEFLAKSSRRIVFKAPSAQQAGGSGEKTVVVYSRRYGRTVVPRGFNIAPMGSKGSVSPSNIPLTGGVPITIEAPDLTAAGEASEFGVELAGVPAQVISVTGTRIVAMSGDASRSALHNQALTSTGLSGDVVVTATVKGKKFAKNLGLPFRYNAGCAIESVESRQGAHGGEMVLIVTGSNLGFADEHITVNGAPAKVHRRERQGSSVFKHHATVPHSAGAMSIVEVVSRRSGRCVWKSAPTATSPSLPDSEDDRVSALDTDLDSVEDGDVTVAAVTPASRAGDAATEGREDAEDMLEAVEASVRKEQAPKQLPASSHFMPAM